MKRIFIATAAVAWGLAAGCGDNERACGMGTHENGSGFCVPTDTCGPGTKEDPALSECVPDGSIVCVNGTKFDPATGTCVIDPNSCQDGTVLINGACVDPTAGLTVDLEEGPEPNGLGIIEASQASAGTITLKAAGGPDYVIHGHISPFRDSNGDGQLDPDVDSYTLTITGPALLDVTANGLHGLDGGFVSIAAVAQNDTLAKWGRFGMNVTNNVSRRQVYLPRAGTYVLAIADTRTLFEFSTGGPVLAAPGGPTADYYITIKNLNIPVPTTLALSGNAGTQNGTIAGDVQFYSVPMGTGLNEVALAMQTVQAIPSIVALQNNAFRETRDGAIDPTTGPQPAGMLIGGFTTTDTTTIVVDDVYNYAVQPISYTLAVRTSNAVPLVQTPCGTAMCGTASETANVTAIGPGFDPLAINQYYFDVTGAAQTIGMTITWNHPVVGELFDGNLDVVATFTSLFGTTTWTSFAGLDRLAQPGRYYFLVYDPTATAGVTQLTATSRIEQLTPVAISEGPTGTGTQNLDANYHSNAYTYAAGTDPWQTFDATGTNTGGQSVTWLDPATAFGRLDTLAVSNGGAPSAAPPDPTPIFKHNYTVGGGAIGRILLDDPSTNYFVKVNATNATSAPTFALVFDKRVITDYGTLAANGIASDSMNHTLDNGSNTRGYFLFRDTTGDRATITVHPQAVTLDAQFVRVTNTETAIGAAVNNPTGDSTFEFVQGGKGWTAFIVSAAVPPASAQMYDAIVTINPPVAYGSVASTTTFTTICGTVGATPVTFLDDGSGVGATDEGLSATKPATPTGFKFYGLATSNVLISTNGWLTFDGSAANAAPTNQNIPDPTAPNNLLAPYWTDLYAVTACTKAPSATQLVVEWSGLTKDGNNRVVHVQALLDQTDQSVTYSYGADETAFGEQGTVGVEDPVGANAKSVCFDTAAAISASSQVKLTPM